MKKLILILALLLLSACVKNPTIDVWKVEIIDSEEPKKQTVYICRDMITGEVMGAGAGVSVADYCRGQVSAITVYSEQEAIDTVVRLQNEKGGHGKY